MNRLYWAMVLVAILLTIAFGRHYHPHIPETASIVSPGVSPA